MDVAVKRKILAGPRLRRLREELGLSQSAMAQELGISLSYLNLLERNQRPLTAQLLIRLSENFTIDLRSFGEGEETGAARELEELFADPVFESFKISRAELRGLAEQAPSLVPAIRHLYATYGDAREWASRDQAGPSLERGEATGLSRSGEILEATRNFLQQNHNHFPALEKVAETIHAEMVADGSAIEQAIAVRLRNKHGIRLKVVPTRDLGVALRHYDRHRKTLMLSDRLEQPSRFFQAAYQLGLIEGRQELEAECARLTADAPQAGRFGLVALANYLAAAIIMPYAPFHAAVEELAYDVDALATRFGVSFEQVAHRLTTLDRPSARGIPFFMVRVDAAGNISKRFSSGAFPFSRMGGTCPRWNIHSTFQRPGRVDAQVVELEGLTWLSIARTVKRLATTWDEPEAVFSVALGCEARFADRIVYFKDLKMKQVKPTQIGVNCRLCSRANCLHRAAPSMADKMQVSEATRGQSPFGF